MLKTFNNRPTIDALSPWTTKQNDQLISLFPQIVPKKRKNKTKIQNLQNQYQAIFKQHKNKQQTLNENIESFKTEKLRLTNKKINPLTQKQQNKQNNLNFIKKSKKQKDSNKIREILYPKPLTSERKYVRSSNYVTHENQINFKAFPKDQLLFKDIENGQNCKTITKKEKDIHSLYLIQKLKGISNTHQAIRYKQSDQKYIKKYQNPFLEYISHQQRPQNSTRKILTQRGPKNLNLKTQGYDSQLKNPLLSIKKSMNNVSYLTHRKQNNHYSLINNQCQQMVGLEKDSFNLQATFAQHKTTSLQNINQNELIEIKNNSKKLKLTKLKNHLEQNDVQEKFQRIQLKNISSAKQSEKISLQSAKCGLNQIKSTQLPVVKEKISFSIQKSNFSLKPGLYLKNVKQERDKQSIQNINSVNIDRQIKKNLRKLRGYLVKKTRDQCLQKGNLNENELYIYQNNINYFLTE